MKKMHYLSIDGDLLQTLIAIYTEGSISKAASRLGQSQSTLSHRLERLRAIIGDPLFVRAGRNITPTRRTEEIVDDARSALDSMRNLTAVQNFNPREMSDHFVIAATDYERAVFLIEAYKLILEEAPNISIAFVWDKYANSTALRNGQFDLAISPVEGANEQDIRRRTLFTDTAACFYDSDVIEAPRTLKRYLKYNHVSVIFSENDISFIDGTLQLLGKSRRISVRMPSISELPYIMKGTPLVATLPSRLEASLMKEFSSCKPPFKISSLTYGLFWHEKTQHSPKHAWLRQKLFEAASQVIETESPR